VQADYVIARNPTRRIGSVVTYHLLELQKNLDGKLLVPELND